MSTIKNLLRFLLICVIAFAISFSVGYVVFRLSGNSDAAWTTNLFGGLWLTMLFGGLD